MPETRLAWTSSLLSTASITVSNALPGTPSASVVSDVFSKTNASLTPSTASTSARIASTIPAPVARRSCSRRRRSSGSVSSSRPTTPSARFFASSQPLTGVSIAPSPASVSTAPALADTVPVSSASNSTLARPVPSPTKSQAAVPSAMALPVPVGPVAPEVPAVTHT